MFETKLTVSYSNLDYRGIMNIHGVVNLFQDCSTLESESLGLGVTALHEKNLVWVLSSWKLKVTRYPRTGEKITVGTFPYEFKGYFGKRQYYLKDEEGEIIALGDTLWILLNYVDNIPTKITDEVTRGYEFNEPYPIDFEKGKILIPKNFEARPRLRVSYHHIDANMHVNNGRYIEMLLDEIEIKDYERVRIEYRKMARLGDILTPCVGYSEGKTIAFLQNEEGESIVIMELG